MSVNEVKIKKAEQAFSVRGTGSPTSRTFCLGDEDHTLGNTLRHVLMQNSAVEFAGYSVPHPSEPVVHIRVQTTARAGEKEEPIAASEALKQACQTLSSQCDFILQKLEDLLPEAREDREALEKRLLEEGYDDGDDEDEY